MSASRTAGRLVRCYPPLWRVRYGEELEALIVDMSDGGRVPWSVRFDVLRSGARERLCGGGTAPDRARGGALLVLWAWALFVVAGAIVAKTSEHWQAAMPAGRHADASLAFGVLVGGAIVAALLVAAGIALALPAVFALLRDDGWSGVRGPVLRAAAATVVLLVGSVALVAWAHSLSASDRDGHDTVYAVVFCGWALLGAGTLMAWTAAAAAIARIVSLGPATLGIEAWLAGAVSVVMAVMTAATAGWWASVAHAEPAALTGGGSSSALVPQLALAGVAMLGATVLGAVGARRALSA